MKQINYIKKDYDAFLEMFNELIEEEFPNWSKYNQNNFGNVFGKFLSMIGDIESFYQDKMIQQLILPTTTLRKYGILACKALGYRMKSALPSSVDQVEIQILPKEIAFTLPSGYPIGTKPINENGEYIHFETDKEIIYNPGETTKIVSSTNGMTINLEFCGVSNGKPNQKFILENRKCIDGYYQCSIEENGVLKTWYEAESFAGQGSKDIFTVEIDELDRAYIKFGDGKNGRIPPQNNQIFATYKIGGGSSTNVGIGTITENKGNLMEIVSIKNLTSSAGGKERESLEEAKINAPIFFKTSERAITKEDFEALCLRNKNVKRSFAKSLGSNMIEIRLASDTETGLATEETKQEVLSYLNERKIITFVINILDPQFVPVDIHLKCNVNDDFLQSVAEYSIISALNNACSLETKKFGQGESLRNIFNVIGNLLEIQEDSLEIIKFTTSPVIYKGIQTASPAHAFSSVNIASENKLSGSWKVTMTSEINYNVQFFDKQQDLWISKGNGVIGEQFISQDEEISFTIISNGGQSVIGDFWTFDTNKYLSNIDNVLETEILKPGIYTIELSGGI